MADQSNDPVVQQFRDQIAENDLAIIDALNKRLAMVQRLHAYKQQQGYDVIDQSREDWVLSYVARANRGPLGDEAARDFFRALLELTTRESARLNAAAAGTPAP
jgi:chorismate mutase